MNTELEPYIPEECIDACQKETQLLDPDVFLEDKPYFDNVKIIERYGVWDGVLNGICEIHGQKFYFQDIVESVWRYYNKQYKNKKYAGKKFQKISRLWRIFAVYGIKIEVLELQNLKTPVECAEYIKDEGIDIIGIFWNYTYEDGAR